MDIGHRKEGRRGRSLLAAAGFPRANRTSGAAATAADAGADRRCLHNHPLPSLSGRCVGRNQPFTFPATFCPSPKKGQSFSGFFEVSRAKGRSCVISFLRLLLFFGGMNQDQEGPGAFSEFGRLTDSLSCVSCDKHEDRHADRQKGFGQIFSSEKERRKMELRGNSCETDDSEHYMQESDFHHHPSNIGPKSETSTHHDTFHHHLAKTTAPSIYHHQGAHSSPAANLDGLYSAYQQHAGCLYSNALYGKMQGARGAPFASADAQRPQLAVVKQEPADGNRGECNEALFNMAYGGHHGDNSTTNKGQTCDSRPENLSTKAESHHLAYTDMLNFYNCGIAHSYQHLHPYLQEGKHTRFA
ncbi:unnamed protein product [Phaedon cochleariae]|uniref:Uncharacterized protein n=1 Tax=Phaedon cochleariae TaxID=80249 RepID=A0A9N9X2Q1_PHACE|nr:unnamed protein product [Phaedon cochleariae]